MSDLKYWIWLLQVLGSHNIKSMQLIDKYGDVEEVYHVIKDGKEKSLSKTEQKNAKKVRIEQSEKIIEQCERTGVDIITIEDEKYPNRLKGIYNPPIVLFCMGDISFIDNEVTITVVGTRKPSHYSLQVAREICGNLANIGAVLVSGFALGIDSVAHGEALSHREKTVAVLGCGIDYDYPSSNTKLKRIIAKNGAVISEFLPGTPPLGANFPQRNRILSGLSLGTLVIEAHKRSGALITAELSIQQGRDLFCIPPADLFDSRYSGVIRFLRDGAIPVFSHLDILYEYYENFSHKLTASNPYSDYSITPQESSVFNTSEKSSSKRKPKKKTAGVKKDIPYNDLDEDQTRIVKLLSDRSYLADELSVMLEMPIDMVLTAMTELEIMGIVKAESGQRYSI
ncbi:MAG: DNA-protecting protein DprA [Clostridiales bacterium]|nr:DNA-protecting protein DprA [Clostridiales bacterium]